MTKITGKLEQWSKDPMFNIYWGYVYGDTKGRFRDGTWIHTSSVVKVEDGFVHTLNSLYELGEPMFIEPREEVKPKALTKDSNKYKGELMT